MHNNPNPKHILVPIKPPALDVFSTIMRETKPKTTSNPKQIWLIHTILGLFRNAPKKSKVKVRRYREQTHIASNLSIE